MSDCLNPDCVTEYRGVMPWLDAEYCSHACLRAHAPRSDREPDPVCARRACGEPADPRLALYGGYCSSACERLDMPAPVEAWAAAMGRSIDGGPIGVSEPDAPFPPPVRAVEPLTPGPAGAETIEPVSEAQKPDSSCAPSGDLRPLTPEQQTTLVASLCSAPDFYYPGAEDDVLVEAPDDAVYDPPPFVGMFRDDPALSLNAKALVRGHPAGQNNPPKSRSHWSRVWARLLRRTA